ncbi:Uncharacterized protein Fot_13768 [Forsythia ovata]|uniref:Uncharacterized protein n=1 Tax=Forsythia ovata TaxID=205694 RepID=A0ABD1W7X8_9LAMI
MSDSDDGSQIEEKQKRLELEQVKALEKSFELGNKLEHEGRWNHSGHGQNNKNFTKSGHFCPSLKMDILYGGYLCSRTKKPKMLPFRSMLLHANIKSATEA